VKRVLRTLLTIATALSAVLCVAVVVLWIRGHFVVDGIEWVSPAGPAPSEVREWYFGSAYGTIFISRAGVTIPRLDAVQSAAWDAWRARISSGVGWKSRPLRNGIPPSSGFIFAHDRDDVPTAWSPGVTVRLDRLRIGLPNWLIALVTAILPAWAALRYFRRRRVRTIGHCTKCGYDLRATPDRCPECGTVPR
jgi:hypothetical protein